MSRESPALPRGWFELPSNAFRKVHSRGFFHFKVTNMTSVLKDSGLEKEVFFCNTTEWAFGPLMQEDEGEAFMEWLPKDPRKYEDEELSQKYAEWKTDYKE